jgi:hypothetical protein
MNYVVGVWLKIGDPVAIQTKLSGYRSAQVSMGTESEYSDWLRKSLRVYPEPSSC